MFDVSIGGSLVEIKTSDYECICAEGFEGSTCGDEITTTTTTWWFSESNIFRWQKYVINRSFEVI